MGVSKTVDSFKAANGRIRFLTNSFRHKGQNPDSQRNVREILFCITENHKYPIQWYPYCHILLHTHKIYITCPKFDPLILYLFDLFPLPLKGDLIILCVLGPILKSFGRVTLPPPSFLLMYKVLHFSLWLWR